MSGTIGLGGIIKDGLVLYLDAANTKSYVGTGNIWADLSRSAITSSLFNTPTFGTSNGGNFLFDGFNQYGETQRDILVRPNYVTISAWVRYTGAQTVTFVGGCGNTNTDGYWLGANSSQFRFQAGNGNLIGGAAPVLNFGTRNSNINYLCGTFDGTTILGYLNGELGGTLNQTTPGPLTYPTGGSSPILGGMFIGILESSLLAARYWTGNIFQIKLYNRALSASEVLQNYNATRSRFVL